MLRRIIKLILSLGVYGYDRLNGFKLGLAHGRAAGRGIILYYHAVPRNQRAKFARQMDMLLKVARPWDLSTCPPQTNLPLVAVTFDDGYVSVIENALPELKPRGIPAILFVPTGSWGEGPCWIKAPGHHSWHERVMSCEDLKKLAAEPLVTIGSHTVSHANLVQVSVQEASRELSGSKADLENLLSRPIEWFSFPHGAYDASLVRLALEAGYRRLFTIEPTLVDPLQPAIVNGRVAVSPEDWPLEFFLKSHGAYRWQARSQNDRGRATELKAR